MESPVIIPSPTSQAEEPVFAKAQKWGGGVTRGAREGGEPGAIAVEAKQRALNARQQLKVITGGLGVIDGS